MALERESREYLVFFPRIRPLWVTCLSHQFPNVRVCVVRAGCTPYQPRIVIRRRTWPFLISQADRELAPLFLGLMSRKR
jgi:hypothetical protein